MPISWRLRSSFGSFLTNPSVTIWSIWMTLVDEHDAEVPTAPSATMSPSNAAARSGPETGKAEQPTPARGPATSAHHHTGH